MIGMDCEVIESVVFKDNEKIGHYCRLALYDITGPQANYLAKASGLSLWKHPS